MKKLMMMSLVCVAGVLFAVPAEKLDLLGAAELAPFGEVTQASSTFGKMVGNPLMATMLVSGAQQGLVKSYGKSRADAPTFWLLYSDAKAIDIALKLKDPESLKNPVQTVLVYPCADGPAQKLLKHVGSTKEEDGTIHLLPGVGRANDMWVKYTADGAFAAFADSAALALRAAKDCEKFIANRKARTAKGHQPLLLARVNEKGLATLVKLQDLDEAKKAKQVKAAKEKSAVSLQLRKTLEQVKQMQTEQRSSMLKNYRGAVLALDLDETGLVFTAKAKPKAGARPVPAAGFQLPAGAFDVARVASPFFGAGCVGLQGNPATAGEHRVLCDALRKLIRDGAAELKNEKDAQKYAKFIDDLVPALEDFLRTMPFTDPADWSAAALAFDAAQHPCVVFRPEAKQAAISLACVTKFLDRFTAACTRQWPAQKVLAKTGATAWTLDVAALVDVFVTLSSKPLKVEEQKSLAAFKSKFAKVMGDTKLLVKFSADGKKGFIGAPNVKPVPAAAGVSGETRLATALPEVAQTRPAGAFCLTPYAFVRETLLPILARMAAKKALAQLQAMQAAMPKPTKNGALAGAAWIEKDGSARAILRVTADEIRNIGAAFNAFTAAAMMGAAEEDDD